MKNNIDKERVARRFSASINTYDTNARGQKIVAHGLVECMAQYLQGPQKCVLEIGCGTGLLSKKLVETFAIDTLYLNDIATNLCQTTSQMVRSQVGEVVCLAGDAEQSVFPGDLDLCASSSTLQWLTDLDGFVRKIEDHLKPGGLFACALYGSGTMQEIKDITGRGLNYYRLTELRQIVEKTMDVVHTQEVASKYYFPSVWAVLKHIKHTGVGGVQGESWTRRRLRQFEQEYKRNYGCELGVPVSYTTLYLLARKKR